MNETKRLRLSTGMTLRAFCRAHGLDPVKQSRIERGLSAEPIYDEKVLVGRLPVIVKPGTNLDKLVDAARNW